jgi:hypothetical protein
MISRIHTGVHGFTATRNKANEFLSIHCPDFKLPIPIESIIQDQLEIEVIPTFGTQVFDGFITGDLRQIYMNKHIYIDRPSQLKYILAREIGLFWMYDYIYKGASFCTPEGWMEFVRSFSDQDYWQIITDVNYFAGLILVPPGLIQMELNTGRINELSLDSLIESFQVERHVMIRRIDEERQMKKRVLVNEPAIIRSG